MPPIDPKLQEQVQDLRFRVLRGEDVSDEELRDAISFLRQGRVTAGVKGSAKKKSEPVTQLSLDDLSSKLEGDLNKQKSNATDATFEVKF